MAQNPAKQLLTTHERVAMIVEENTGIKDIPADATLPQLAADSLELAGLVVELETEFNVDLEPAQSHLTVEGLVTFLDSRSAR